MTGDCSEQEIDIREEITRRFHTRQNGEDYAFSMVSGAYDKGAPDDAGKYKADRSDH